MRPAPQPQEESIGAKTPTRRVRVRGGNPVRALLTRGRTPVRPQAASPPSGGASERAGSEGPKRAYPGPWPEPLALPTAECRSSHAATAAKACPSTPSAWSGTNNHARAGPSTRCLKRPASFSRDGAPRTPEAAARTTAASNKAQGPASSWSPSNAAAHRRPARAVASAAAERSSRFIFVAIFDVHASSSCVSSWACVDGA